MAEVWSKDGVLTMPGSGAQFVVDCVTGRLIPRNKARFIGTSPKYGGPFWIDERRDILEAGPMLFESKPKDAEKHKEEKSPCLTAQS